MRTWKRWLYERFLPAWCKDELLEHNRHLEQTVAAQQREIERLRAYIRGMQDVLRRVRVKGGREE